VIFASSTPRVSEVGARRRLQQRDYGPFNTGGSDTTAKYAAQRCPIALLVG